MSEYCKNCEKLQEQIEELETINQRLLHRLEVDDNDTSLVFKLDKELRIKGQELATAIIKQVELQQENEKLKEKWNTGFQKFCDKDNELQAEREKVKKLEEQLELNTANAVVVDYATRLHEYKQALDEIEEKAKELITHTPEYGNCYFKDQCGEYCPPKRTQKFDICLYQEVDKILDIISKAKGGE